jgi:hypothetical protein
MTWVDMKLDNMLRFFKLHLETKNGKSPRLILSPYVQPTQYGAAFANDKAFEPKVCSASA